MANSVPLFHWNCSCIETLFKNYLWNSWIYSIMEWASWFRKDQRCTDFYTVQLSLIPGFPFREKPQETLKALLLAQAPSKDKREENEWKGGKGIEEQCSVKETRSAVSSCVQMMSTATLAWLYRLVGVQSWILRSTADRDGPSSGDLLQTVVWNCVV